MLTPLTLNDAITKFIRENTNSLKLKALDANNEPIFKNPQSVSGWIMPKAVGSDEHEFPFVITRIEKVENVKNERYSIVTVRNIFGVYNPGTYDEKGNLIDDSFGYRDIWNLIEVVRQRLFETRVLENRYRLIGDFFEAELFSEEIYPLWQGYCLTKWEICLPN